MSSQSRTVFGVLAIVAAVSGFWFALLAPKRTDTSAVQDKIAQAETRRDAAVAAAGQAEHARARYIGDYATVARLGKAVPADDDVASLVYQLETIARANRIDFRAVKLTGGAGKQPAAPKPPPTERKGEGSDGPATATSSVAPLVAQSPPGTVVGPAGLLTVPFTFTFDGGYLKMARFLEAINGLANGGKQRITVRGRLLTVDGFSLAASRDGFPKVKALVSATAYLAPDPDGITGGATPQGPAGATAAAPTTTALIAPHAQAAGR